MWSEIQLAYLAGIIDGEGSLYIQAQKRSDRKKIAYFPRFQVPNTNEKLIDWLHTTFGGYRYRKERTKYNPKWRTQYEWFTDIPLLDKLLPLIIPYLLLKQEHAKIMLEFRETFNKYPGRNTLPDSVQNFREECLHKLKSLNKRGIDLPSPLSSSP